MRRVVKVSPGAFNVTVSMVCVDLKLHIFLSELLGLSEFILSAGVCGSDLRDREGVTQSIPN